MKIKKLHDLNDLSQEIITAEKSYNYQPQLTKRLDNYLSDFSETTLLEIVLWKTNRYPTITQEIIDEINKIRKDYSEDKARLLLKKLLELKGFDLPMASTVLRFAVPTQLQIIDQRVYRFITKNEDYLKIPYNIDQKINLYFKYIQRLHEICSEIAIPFSKSDRILYQLDKIHNKNIPLKTSE